MPLQGNDDNEVEMNGMLRLSEKGVTYDLSNLCLSGGARRNNVGERNRQQQRRHSLYPSESDLAELRASDMSPDNHTGRARKQKDPPRCSQSPQPLRSYRRHTIHACANNSSLPAFMDAGQQTDSFRARSGGNREEGRNRKEPPRPVSPDAFSRSSSYSTSHMDPPSLQSSSGYSTPSSDDSSSFDESFQNMSYHRHVSARDAQSPHARYSDQRYHHGQRSPTPSQSTTAAIEIEISPGYSMPLRGSLETMLAIQNGSASIVQCLLCNASLSCVPDCELVVCPECRVLSPARNEHHHHSNLGGPPRHVKRVVGRGVGLGVKLEVPFLP